MTDHDLADLGPTAQLVSLHVADVTGAWDAAGFTIIDDQVRLGATTIDLIGSQAEDRRGITGWRLSGVTPAGHDEHTVHLPEQLDGLPTTFLRQAGAGSDDPGPPGSDEPPTAHPNGAIGIDHVVLSTPDLERTIAAMSAVGVQCRRIRETEADARPMRQAFFRLGPSIVEVVSGADGSGTSAEDDPATFFGLAIDVEDLDETVALLGDGISRPKAAVQPGRRIATLRHRSFDMSVAVALMDDHADR